MAIRTGHQRERREVPLARRKDPFTWDWSFRPFLPDLSSLERADRTLAAWGMACVVYTVLLWLAPQNIGANFFTPYPSMGINLAFVITATIRRPKSMPMAFTFVMVILLQLWSFATNVHSEIAIGRPLLVNRSSMFWTEDLIYLLLTWHLVKLLPSMRLFVTRVVVAAFALSSFVGWLQFARFPLAVRLSTYYTYKAIDNWDGHPGIRAVGLTFQPNLLMFEALLGMAFIAAPVLYRKLKFWEIAGAIFFSGAAVFTQARAGLPSLGVAWMVVLYFTFRHDPKQGRFILGVLSFAFVGLIAVAIKRFAYFIMTTSGSDASAAFRQDVTWAQLAPIFPRFEWWGIGPSDGLLLGTGPEDKYVPIGHVMESAYRVILAMNGIPGVALFVIAIVGSAFAALRALRNPEDEQHRLVLAVGFLCAMHVAINAYAFNTVDGYVSIPCCLMIAGLAIRTKPIRLKLPMRTAQFPAIAARST